jgi:hypothetical protein
MSFHVGQRVVCVCVNFSREPVWRGTIRVFPALNRIYTIRSLRQVDDVIGLCFEEMVHLFSDFAEGYVEPAFDSRRFRPVRTTDIDLVPALLVPLDAELKREPELV